MLLLILILAEFLAPEVLRQHYYSKHRTRFYVTVIIHVIFSLWLWLLYFETITFNSFYDSPEHIWRLMALNGTIAAVILPRLVLVAFHFSGKLIRFRTGGHIRWLTNAGIVFMGAIFAVTVRGNLRGRFNLKTEFAEIPVKNLHPDLEGLKIVQLSDLHLASYNHHRHKIIEVADIVNSYQPDLIINTGDFITFGWREFDGFDSILVKAKSRYGNFAVMGNHDFGSYHPDYSEAEERNNVLVMRNLIRKSGYKLLYEENVLIKKDSASIMLIGIITEGSHPNIKHGDVQKAMTGTDTADLKILLSHDPNHWEEAVAGKTDIDLTLSGHTHGMQIGVITKKTRWSPAKYFYPHWNGLFSQGEQYHYVNRGLGVLGVPFRVWMPPEITVITLVRH